MIFVFFLTDWWLEILWVSVWKNCAKMLAFLKDRFFLGDISGYVYEMIRRRIYFNVSAETMIVMLISLYPSRIIIFLVLKSNMSLVRKSKHFFLHFLLNKITVLQFWLQRQKKVNFRLFIVMNTACDISEIIYFTKIWGKHF